MDLAGDLVPHSFCGVEVYVRRTVPGRRIMIIRTTRRTTSRSYTVLNIVTAVDLQHALP